MHVRLPHHHPHHHLWITQPLSSFDSLHNITKLYPILTTMNTNVQRYDSVVNNDASDIYVLDCVEQKQRMKAESERG